MTIRNIATELGKDAPIAGLAGAHFMGLTLNDWGLTLGVAYAIGRFAWFLVECYWKWKDRRNGKPASD